MKKILMATNNKGKIKNDEIYELICKVKNSENLKKFINELETLNFINKVNR